MKVLLLLLCTLAVVKLQKLDLGKTCSSNTNCTSGYCNLENKYFKICCAEEADSKYQCDHVRCDDGNVCASRLCANYFCTSKYDSYTILTPDACIDNSNCSSGMCVNKKCAYSWSDRCSYNTDCQSRFCNNGFCSPGWSDSYALSIGLPIGIVVLFPFSIAVYVVISKIKERCKSKDDREQLETSKQYSQHVPVSE
jgi:hypothetical protein